MSLVTIERYCAWLYADGSFSLILSISKMIYDFKYEFSQCKHFCITDIVEQLCHFISIWGCIVVSLDIFGSVLSKKGTIK